MGDLFSVLNALSRQSSFSASLCKRGGYITFSNSGRRGESKCFSIGIDSLIQTLKDILDNLSVFKDMTEYVESEWRNNGAEYFKDPVANATSTVQTKPLFSTLSKLIIWGNQPRLDNINSDQRIVLDNRSIQNTIEKLEGIAESFSPAKNTLYHPNNEIIKLLNEKRNVILTGAPGTGKTFTAKAIASYIVSDGKSDWKGLTEEQKKQVGFVQFHPSYDYTDFVEGLRPIAGGDFRRQDGVFKAFCKRAISSTTNESSTSSDAKLLTAKYESSNTQQDKPAKNELSGDNKYVFIIDEINRGELSKIFGELFYAIEPDYRGKAGTVQTQYNNLVEDDDVFKPGFYIPENVYIIGTMNDIDRGVEAMDFAIRRRFAWKEVTAEESAENMGITGLALEKMKALNKALMENGLSRACCIGGAYFRKLKDDDYDSLWKYHLEGIVYEYFRGEPDAEEKLQVVKEAFGKANLPASEETSNVQEETEEDLAE